MKFELSEMMEEASNSNQRSLERVVSQKALQMGSSFPCQIFVVGFFCGVCIATFILAALTSFGHFSFSNISMLNLSWNSDLDSNMNCSFKPREIERLTDLKSRRQRDQDQQISLLYSAWDCVLTKPAIEGTECLQKLGISGSNLPSAPHLENCKLKTWLYNRLDTRRGNDTFPPWMGWKGLLDMHPFAPTSNQIKNFRHQSVSEGAYPPWVVGSDEENYPLTRKVQRDIWIHQHPSNCRNPDVKFLLADWERLPGFGIGAQIAGMCGLLAIAMNEGRVLVTDFYNRADHDGCKGSSRSNWNCYFLPETSLECRQRALELMKSEDAWREGILTTKDNYTSKHIWAGPTPRIWGNPWNYLQPTTDINGTLMASHRKMDRRWWRAQAVRYLMKFPTEYTCNLLNEARHAAFGKIAAKMVLESLDGEWPKEIVKKPKSDIDKYVWSNHKPWVPRPLLSMHVRMGDKACEMRLVEFEEYMQLADRIRNHFPNLNSIWLSKEMQEVIDKTEEYSSRWNFYYTKVRRQDRSNVSMAEYEASLGRETSTNYPLVNFLMAADSDFFCWSFGFNLVLPHRWNEKYWGKGYVWLLKRQQGQILQLPLTRPKSPKLSRRKSFGDAINPSPEICTRARLSAGTNLKNASSSPVPKRTKDVVTGRNSNGTCKTKERSKLDKETKAAPPKITEQTNANISVES